MSGMSREVLIDTSIWVEYFKGSKIGEKAKKRYIDNPRYNTLTSVVTVVELTKHFTRNEFGSKLFMTPEDILGFLKLKGEVLPLTEEIAILGGKLLGNAIFGKLGIADYLILASAIENSVQKVVTKEDKWEIVNNHYGKKFGTKRLNLEVDVIMG